MENPPPPPPPLIPGTSSGITQKRKRGRPLGSRTKSKVTFPMYPNYQQIHQLKEGISVHPITVCVRNIWDIKIHRPSNTQSGTGFICYDHRGRLLEGRFFNNNQTSEPIILVEGDEYEFSGFSVLPNFHERKLTQLTYFIQIDQKTTISNVTYIGSIFPAYSFSPQNYECLLRSVTTASYLPDVVGQIRLLQDIKPHNPESNTKVTIGLMLNKSKMVRLTLWDKSAVEFSTLHCKLDRRFAVVIITSIIPRLFKGTLELNSSPATTFFFNKTIEHIKNYKGRIRRHRQT